MIDNDQIEQLLKYLKRISEAMGCLVLICGFAAWVLFLMFMAYLDK